MACNSSTDNCVTIIGLNATLFYILLILQLALWVWALIALIQHWNKLDTVWQVLGVVFLVPVIPFGPVFTLLIAYIAGRGEAKNNTILKSSPDFFGFSLPSMIM